MLASARFAFLRVALFSVPEADDDAIVGFSVAPSCEDHGGADSLPSSVMETVRTDCACGPVGITLISLAERTSRKKRRKRGGRGLSS